MAETQPTTPQAPATPRGTSLLTTLGINPDAVLGASNIAQTMQSPAQPTSDALGIFTGQEEAFGVGGLQEAYNVAQGNVLEAQNLANQEQVTLQGRRKKLGVMRGEQAQAAQQAQVDIQTLQTQQQLAGTALQSAQSQAMQAANILYSEYQTKQNLMLQHPGLDINPLTDSMEKISGKLEEYQKDKVKDDEKDAYKKALRDMGLSTKGSRRELERRLSKENKTMADQVKRQNDLKLQGLEMDIAKAQKALIAPTIEEEKANLWENQITGKDSLGQGTSDMNAPTDDAFTYTYGNYKFN